MAQEKPPQNSANIGYIKPREITEEMTESYIDYAMSVIVARALPDVRDGLKPVQRRILYAMIEEGLRHNAKFRKSATVVGAVLGRYHPHGDVAVYDALARMAQDFSLRYPLVQGQGNFGSVDGDPPAASRYTEARLSNIGEDMLKDIEKNAVDFADNYDASRKEPIVLPSPLPQLLLNGSIGIAVGMATNIPPHNLIETCQALAYLIDNPDAETEDLVKFIKGPDFPTGGIIYGGREMAAVYSQGKGSVVIRGKSEVLQDEKGKDAIIITEIPFQVSKADLLEHFARLVEQKQIEGVKDIRDESDREGMRIVIELAKGAFPQKILNRLYKFTDLQKSFHLNMIALADGIQPKLMSLADILNYFLEHRREVITRRLKFDLERTRERTHILEGLQKCLACIDDVIKTIKASSDRDNALKNLVQKFKLTEIQANAILETKLQQLAKLEREKIESELEEKRKLIKEFEVILKSPAKIRNLIKKELQEIQEKYGDDRKTKVLLGNVSEISEEDLIPQEETVIILTQEGFIKRVKPDSYRAQKRGGKGLLGAKIGEDDVINHFILANTHDLLLFFTDSGKVFQLPAYEIAEASRLAKGKHVANFLEVSPEDKILSILPCVKKEEEAKYLTMVTEKGIVKKTALEEFENVRKSGLIAIKLKKGDLLKKVLKTSGEDKVMLMSQKGQSILFKEKDVRPMGRASAGIRGIRLDAGDKVIGMGIITAKGDKEKTKGFQVLTISENGFGKRTPIAQYRIQGRGGSGTKTAKITGKTGLLSVAEVLAGREEHLIIVSQKGQVIKTEVNAVSVLSRSTQGVKLIKVEKGDKVASAVCI